MVNKDRRCKRKRHPCVEGHAQNIIDFGRVVGGQGAGQALNRKNREQASSSSLSQPSCSSINEEQLVICMTRWQIIPVYVYVVFCGLVCMDRHIGVFASLARCGKRDGCQVRAGAALASIGIVADWRSRHGMEKIVVEAHGIYALQVTSPQVAVDEVVAAPVGWSPQEVDCPRRHV